MRTRAIQLAVVIALGAGIGLLITRPWQSSAPPEVPDIAPTAAAPAPKPTARLADEAVAPPSPRPFNLPKMSSAAAPATQAKAPEEPLRPEIKVPRHWLLRGTGPQGYDVKSDRTEVFSGQSSVVIKAHDKNVAATKNASLMQNILAGDLAGKRVEFSMSTRSSEFRREIKVWIRATDSGGAVIAYDENSSAYGKQEWQKPVIVVDIPWSAAEVAYGVTLVGTGAIWVDDAELRIVDEQVTNPTGRMRPNELGVVVQTADRDGPLPTPSNMDFEDVVEPTSVFRELPKDELGKSRF